MTLRLLALAATVLLAGCGHAMEEIGKEPAMTPIGAGLNPTRMAGLEQPMPKRAGQGPNSLWRDESADLFRDPRAQRVGDVVTVRISIKDKASLDNSSQRQRDANRNLSGGASYDLNYPFSKSKGDGKADANVNSSTSTKSEGAIARSESIELLVAAVVSEVLPNGNMVISGTQEVRVNYEIRVLSVAGMVRPRDIATDNSVSYDKIAEARISYGGRGRISEVQQPGWGHQLLDWLSPF